MSRSLVLLLASVCAIPALAQPAEPTPPEIDAEVDPSDDGYADEEPDEAVVVVGQRDPRLVVGDIPPEDTLDARDIRATGATSIDELLEALAPQIGSARGREAGGRPIMLLNGRRISGFRELRDIPPEAIEKMEILPEEVALKYGYKADQRVVNIVLRNRFRSTAARADGTLATEGGYGGGLAEVTRLMINRQGRTTFNLRAETNGKLGEDERDIDLEDPDPLAADPRPYRSLVGQRRLVRGSAVANRTIFGDVSATANGELEYSDGRSGIGLDELDPLRRDSNSRAARTGIALNGDVGRWRWSSTGNAEWSRSETFTDREGDFTDKSRTMRTSGNLDGTATGPLFKLPAGDASATVKLGVDGSSQDSERRRLGVVSDSDLGRTRGVAGFNLDLPVSRRNRDFAALGNLTLNANAEAEQYSDFGTLTTIGAGANWSPADRLNFIASWTREEGAPSVAQLGDPILETPHTPIFDFTTGQTVDVTAITGGNQALSADRRNVLKFGGNWKPWAETDLRIRAEYVRSTLDNPISSFPGPSPELEAAFPERFVRDGSGNLLSVDLRPVNFDRARRDTLRWGVDVSKPLRSARPTEAQIAQMRARFARPGGAQGQRPPSQSARPGEAPAAVERPSPDTDGGPGAGRGGGRRFGGGFGGRGGGNRGRLTFSFTHTVNLVDEVTIRPGVPELDYLDGAAVGSSGGRPRHQIEARAGWSNNGLGARLSGNWRSGTKVEGGENGDLRFSPLGTVDLRLFANLGERFDLVSKHPWLIGSSVRLEVDNLFDAKPKVRDAFGDVPFSYQADRLDPLGRTVTISFRKLFLPQRFRARSRASETTR
jgi:iron complex outermembrane recepter protein